MARIQALRTARTEAYFLLKGARLGAWRSVGQETRFSLLKVREALARDVAWLLPRDVALWAYIRVMAHATQGSDSLHPDDVTYSLAYDRWVHGHPVTEEPASVQNG